MCYEWTTHLLFIWLHHCWLVSGYHQLFSYTKRELQNTENSMTRPSTSARIVKFYSCVCLYVWPKKKFIYTLSWKRCILLAHPLPLSPEIFARSIESYTESGILHICICIIVSLGFLGAPSNIMMRKLNKIGGVHVHLSLYSCKDATKMQMKPTLM